MGIQGRLTPKISPGYGFDGIAVALIGAKLADRHHRWRAALRHSACGRQYDADDDGRALHHHLRHTGGGNTDGGIQQLFPGMVLKPQGTAAAGMSQGGIRIWKF
jgi:hypothetical protein